MILFYRVKIMYMARCSVAYEPCNAFSHYAAAYSIYENTRELRLEFKNMIFEGSVWREAGLTDTT
jgi:hypothetical protein